MRKVVAVLCAIVLGSTAGEAQPGGPPLRMLPMIRDFVDACAFWTPAGTKDRIDVFLRLNRALFVAFRDAGGNGVAPFRRLGEATIELVDSTGSVQAREIERIEIPEAEVSPGDETPRWYQGQFSFMVPRGPYKVRVEVVDLQSKNRWTRSVSVRTIPSRSDSLLCSPGFFYFRAPGAVAPDTLVPQNYGGGILFSSPGGLCLELVGADTSARMALVSSRFLVLEANDRPGTVLEADSAREVPLRWDAEFRALTPVGYVMDQVKPAARAVILLPLPLEKLPLRRFRLELSVHVGQKQTKTAAVVPVIWPEMPESLRDVDYAIESLRFLVSERKLDSLKDGSFEERRDHLEKFWQDRNPNRGAAENPLETEYYRRVDHAQREFATLRQPDGTKTDRGKIFILFGPPNSSKRSLDPARGYTEVWSYTRARKEFVFRDEARDGTYVLTSTLEL
jgi:GWxTD domain-containing protein